MATTTVPESGLLTEVPDDLKKLAKYIMRGFYQVEHALIVDILVRNIIMKEDDLAEILKFDKKHIRMLLNKLKSDKLLKQTMRVETQPDGKATRHYYYFINYKLFVNVVKYKLDRMRQKIEHREKNSTCKALFKCLSCEKTYNEFDALDLLDRMTNEMFCTYCGSEVKEDETVVQEKDTFMQIALFNEQMKPIFDLLREVEHIRLAPEVLEPTPQIANDNSSARQSSQKPRGPHDRMEWSGDASRKAYDLYNQEVTIDMGGETNTSQASTKQAKALPEWLSRSTVDGAVSEPHSVTQSVSAPATDKHTPKSKGENEEIMKALLAHERMSGSKGQGHVTGVSQDPASDNESDESASDDEYPSVSAPLMEHATAFGMDMEIPTTDTIHDEDDGGDGDDDDDEEDDEEEEVMVSVAGKQVPFSDVTPDMVPRMTPSEKELYIRLGQEAYAAMHE